jgi:hypothetical protein
MTNRPHVLVLLVFATAAAACTSPRASTEEEVVAGTADAATAVRDGVSFVLWDVPKFFIWTVPKALVYEYPRNAILAIRGNRAQVAAAISDLESNDLPPETEAAISENLRHMTGLPIRSNERWIEWWQDASSRPVSEWRSDFIRGAIHDLESRNYFIRTMAIEDLRTMYGETLQYDPKDTPEKRAKAAERWRDWLQENGLPPLPKDPGPA